MKSTLVVQGVGVLCIVLFLQFAILNDDRPCFDPKLEPLKDPLHYYGCYYWSQLQYAVYLFGFGGAIALAAGLLANPSRVVRENYYYTREGKARDKKYCPTCGKPSDIAASFCQYCGQQIPDVKPPVPPEKKEVEPDKPEIIRKNEFQ